MQCLSEGEMEECCSQVQWLLENCWISLLLASHAVSVVFARKADW